MLAAPAPTQFDLRFRLLAIPVVINPFFWLVTAVTGWQNHDRVGIFIWIACVFVSILIHELGHGLTGRAVAKERPSIVLYYLGGLCISDREPSTPGKRIAILLMGPGAGFLLFGLVFVFSYTVLGLVQLGPFFGGTEPFVWQLHDPPRWNSPYLWLAIHDLFWINLVWGLVNLLPIYPLDGGQIAGVLLKLRNKWEGARWGYMLSMVTAGLMAFLLYWNKQELNALLAVSLGMYNFQLWQAARYQGRYGDESEDDDDWWKR